MGQPRKFTISFFSVGLHQIRQMAWHKILKRLHILRRSKLAAQSSNTFFIYHRRFLQIKLVFVLRKPSLIFASKATYGTKPYLYVLD